MKNRRGILFSIMAVISGCFLICALMIGGYFLWGQPLINSMLPTATPMDKISIQATLSAYSYEMEQYYGQDNMQKWMEVADKAVALDPSNYRMYFYRAYTFKLNAEKQIGLLQYMEILARGLQDIDKAISLENSNGDTYLVRGEILSDMGEGYPYRADRTYFYEKALENVRKAAKLGSPQNLHPERQEIIYLTTLGECDSALDKTKQLSDIIPTGDASSPTLEKLYELSFACQGDYKKAYKYYSDDLTKIHKDNIPSINAVIYLYHLGRTDEALNMIEQVTQDQKYRNGAYYFMRAVIEYDQGRFIQALQDADLAERYDWNGEAFIAYIEGLEAVRNGKKDIAISKLQFAEATLDIKFDFALNRARLELEKLNAKPLRVTPAVHISATPIPY